MLILFFFFFKQKTAYEMRISDWSSDVCSSDLVEAAAVHLPGLAAGTLRQPGPLFQAEVEGDKIEGAADPGDAGDDVQPAHRQLRPLPKHPQNDPGPNDFGPNDLGHARPPPVDRKRVV